MDRIQRLVFEHRRPLAATCAALAVLTALGAMRQSPPTTRVVVAAHDLASGHTLTEGDVRPVDVPAGVEPSHALSDEADVVGRRVAGPMRAGEALTDHRVLHADSLDGRGADAVLATVRVADAEGLTGVQVGDRVDVVAVDPDGEETARVAAREVEVVMLPEPSLETDGATVGVVTTEEEALGLAASALTSRFSVLARGGR